MSDPMTSMWKVLKPPKGFESWYQGNAVATNPIAMIPENPDGSVTVTDVIPPSSGLNWDPLMVRYMPVPLGSTVVIWFPRIMYIDQAYATQEKTYRYELRWRIRSLQDRIASNKELTYSVPGVLGRNTTVPAISDPQWVVPACIGSVITPALPADTNNGLSLDSHGNKMADSQGMYGTTVLLPDAARGPIYYPPVLVPAIGDELAIYAYRAATEGIEDWQFKESEEDAEFSHFYGTGDGSLSAPWSAGQGIYVCTQGRATYP